MAFLTGRITCLRFKVDGPRPRMFDGEHIERLELFQAGRQKVASSDGIEYGWLAGDHIQDTAFSLEKNIYGDFLLFDLCIVTDKLPADKLKAYYSDALKEIVSPSQVWPSSRQRKEAKELARERLETESRDGRYRKHKLIPCAWDCVKNEVYFGSTSMTHIDRLVSLFQQTFSCGLEAMTAGKVAFNVAGTEMALDDAMPSGFVPSASNDVAWIADETSRDFLGNEFLLWLWYYAEVESDTIKLSDKSEVTYMVARSLKLDCPRGQTGHDAITHEGPSRLPEAKRAIQGGKLPRKCGITAIRHGHQYEFTLSAETLAVNSMRLPNAGEDVKEPRARSMDRLDRFRDGLETIELMYEHFLRIRLNKVWGDCLAHMQGWLKKGERTAGI